MEATAANAGVSMQKKVCYLTFDDGPSKHTEQILDILEKYNANATFFVIGKELQEEDGTVLQRMIEDGHAIGLHSNVHNFDELYGSVERCVQDFDSQYNTLKEVFGIDTKIFRFPGGSACSYMNGKRQDYIKAMKENGYICFDWHVSGEDSYGNPTVWSIQKNIFDHLSGYQKPIILLHDMNMAEATVEALPGILEKLKSEGYELKPLTDSDEYIYR